MGDFRFEMNMVGGHGCQREKKDGEVIEPCGSASCPDCICAEFVEKMRTAGVNVKDATLVHWPNSRSAVLDVFVQLEPVPYGFAGPFKRVRRGSF